MLGVRGCLWLRFHNIVRLNVGMITGHHLNSVVVGIQVFDGCLST